MLFDFKRTRVVEVYPGVFIPQVMGFGCKWYGVDILYGGLYSPILKSRLPLEVSYYEEPIRMLEYCRTESNEDAQEVLRIAKIHAEALGKLT